MPDAAQMESGGTAGLAPKVETECSAAPKPCSTPPPDSPRRRLCTACRRSIATTSARSCWLIIGLFLFGGLAGILDVTVPAFIGRVVGLVSNHTPQTLLHDAWPQLARHGRGAAAAAAGACSSATS